MNPFENISEKNQEKLLKMLRSDNVKYKRNQSLKSFFKDAEDIGIIVSGTIEIVRNNYNGSTTIIEKLDKNDILDLSILYNDDEYDIIAKEDSEIILMNYNNITNQDISDKTYNQFIKNLFIIINTKQKEKNERIKILTKKTIREKLLEYFNLNSKKSGSRNIYLPFNFSELSNYLAIDRSAMSRELGYMKEEGIITVKGKRITLLYR